MNYEPSHRKPPRQERWPDATPGEGWPAYQQGDGGRAWESAEAFARTNGYGTASNGYGAASDGYGIGSGGYGAASNGHGVAGNGYGISGGGYGIADNGYDIADNGYDVADNGYDIASGGYGATSHSYSSPSNGYGDRWGGRGPADGGYGEVWGGARYSDPGPDYWTGGGNGYGGATTAYPAGGDGYSGDGYADGFDGAADGFDGGASGGYGGGDYADRYRPAENYYEAPNGWDGYAEPGHDFTGSAGYVAPDDYPALDPGASSVLVAPDTMGEWWRDADRGRGDDRDQSPGPVVGAVTGLLAAAVAIGVATLAAAFVRPQSSPVSAVGGVLIDRLPATLRNHLMAHFGVHAQTLLLLGAIGLIAVVLGGMARHNASIAVAALAAFGLLGAFVAITRPASRASDVIPSVIGALAGIAALLWLDQASKPVASVRPASGGGRRRPR